MDRTFDLSKMGSTDNGPIAITIPGDSESAGNSNRRNGDTPKKYGVFGSLVFAHSMAESEQTRSVRVDEDVNGGNASSSRSSSREKEVGGDRPES